MVSDIEKILIYFVDRIAARDVYSDVYISLAYWFKEIVNYRGHERQDYCVTRFLARQEEACGTPFPFEKMVNIARGV